MATTKPPAGMRDFLPADLVGRQWVMNTIREVYERHHFEPLDTPVLERIETLTGKYGDEGDQLMFKVVKRAHKLTKALSAEPIDPHGLVDMGMRYDLTVPLCRVVAQYQNDLPRIFKRYQIAPVWRADRPAKGRFREFYQCDVDVIGSDSVLVEVDVLTAAAEAMRALGFSDFSIRVNDRQLLAAMTAAAGISAERSGAALVTLDKMDKIGRDGVSQELERNGLEASCGERLFELIAVGRAEDQTARERLASFSTALGDHCPEAAVARLDRLLELLEAVETQGAFAFDPALARGLTYYTGPIFEVSLPDYRGSVGGGGRYDNLVGMFLGRPIPACGISLGVERLIMIMSERGMFSDDLRRCDVYVAQFDAVDPAVGLRLANTLRASALRVNVSPEAPRLKKQLKLAQQLGARAVILIGPGEAQAGTAIVKDMALGAQTELPLGDVAAHVARLIAGPEA